MFMNLNCTLMNHNFFKSSVFMTLLYCRFKSLEISIDSKSAFTIHFKCKCHSQSLQLTQLTCCVKKLASDLTSRTELFLTMSDMHFISEKAIFLFLLQLECTINYTTWTCCKHFNYKVFYCGT